MRGEHRLIALNFALACPWVQMQMRQKRNVVLYLDTELVSRTRELGFNLSKTFENHLKHLIAQFSNVS